MKINCATYIGKKVKDKFIGYITTDNLFIILEINDVLFEEKGIQFLKLLEESVKETTIDHLIDFDNWLTDQIRINNLPLGTSIASIYLKSDKLFLKTINDGEIYIKRKNQLTKLIETTNTASGYFQEEDLFILTTTYFSQITQDLKSIKQFLSGETSDIVEKIQPVMAMKDETSSIALFLNFQGDKKIYSPKPSLSNPLETIQKKFTQINQNPDNQNKKKITLLMMVVILGILVWSVGLGNQRRLKLRQAEEAKKILLAKEAEDKRLKKEDKNYEEFFDLKLDSQDAIGQQLSLSSDQLAILNNKKNMVYIFSLSQKSLDKKTDPSLKEAKLVGYYENTLFFYTQSEGVYEIKDKIKKIIENDKDWGELKSIVIYNGNIYVMDIIKSQIYKYLVTDNGYSDKKNYFPEGETHDLQKAQSMSIDGSIYINFIDEIVKFTTGERDEFKTVFPESDININKIFTNRDMEKVYAWDKNKSAIYILAKNGTYEKQINSSIFNKASDFVIYNNAAYMLVGSKIYKVNLN